MCFRRKRAKHIDGQEAFPMPKARNAVTVMGVVQISGKAA